MGSSVVFICLIISSVFLLISIILGYELKTTPFGLSDFENMVEEGRLFVDKTLFIKDVITLHPKLLLITRPPKTGTSINLSMLRVFLDHRTNSTEIFKNTSIAQHSKFGQDHQNKYPVIYLNFRNFHGKTYGDMKDFLKDVFANLYTTHDYLLHSILDGAECGEFLRVSEKACVTLQPVLYKLTQHVSHYYKKKVYVIIDGCDAILQRTFKSQEFPEIHNYLKGMLVKALKDNENVESAILAGIAPTVKSGIFSDLKVLVDSVLKPIFPYSNGFTDEEVKWLVKESGKNVNVENLRAMYGGNMVGGLATYNPYSVTLSVTLGRIEPFWAETVSVDSINRLLNKAGPLEKMNFEKLLSNRTIQKPIYNDLNYADLNTDERSFWTLLVHGGFLSAVLSHTDVHYFIRTDVYNLTIPNMDAHKALMHVPDKISSITESDTATFCESLVTGRAEAFYEVVSKFFKRSGSYHQWGHLAEEKDYYSFMCGLVRMLDEEHYKVQCNHKSGLGYHDIAIFPTNSQKKGVIFGFKKASQQKNMTASMQKAAGIAGMQILQKPCLTSFSERKIKEVLVIGMSFFKKETAMNYTVVTNAENFNTSRLSFRFLYHE